MLHYLSGVIRGFIKYLQSFQVAFMMDIFIYRHIFYQIYYQRCASCVTHVIYLHRLNFRPR